MPILSEFALVPDIFGNDIGFDEKVALIRLEQLKDMLFDEGVVRDLRGGEWHNCLCSNSERLLHRLAKEIVKKLEKQGRLLPFTDVLSKHPASDLEWCEEAIASSGLKKLKAIIATENTRAHFENESVTSIEKLTKSHWWEESRADGGSIRIDRKMDAYIDALRLPFACSNNIMFIDGNLDPTKRNYSDFCRLIDLALRKKPTPTIEIHRKITQGSGRNSMLLKENEWSDIFNDGLSGVISKGAEVEVFLWDEMHDRYLVTNLIALNLPYGFDTSTRANDLTTWTRLGRKVRDDLIREFDPASHQHRLVSRFKVQGDR